MSLTLPLPTFLILSFSLEDASVAPFINDMSILTVAKFFYP